MTNKPVGMPAQLTACVNDFLSLANEMQNKHPYDAISASMLYAAARYNVHGFVQQGTDRMFSREDFVLYMTDLYRRMLEEQVDVLGAGQGANP